MATSGSYTLTVTGITIIQAALRNVDALGLGETPASSVSEFAKDKVNFLLKQWEGDPSILTPGLQMWQREEGTLTPSASANNYSLKPSGGDLAIQIPESVLYVLLKETATGNTSELTEMSFAEFQAIGDKTSQKTPQKYHYEKRTDQGKLYLNGYCTSDVVSNYTLQVGYRQPIEIIDALANDFDVTPECYRALEWALSRELSAANYGSPWTTLQETVYSEAMVLMASHEPEKEKQYFEPDRDL